MRFFKRKIGILALTLGVLMTFTACNKNEPTKTTEIPSTEKVENKVEKVEEDKDYSFKILEKGKVVDSIGREVQLPEKITKIAVAGPPAQMMMFTIAPEMLVGWGRSPGLEMEPYLTDELMKLPELGTFFGKNASLNYEELIKLQPDVIIDVGEVKKDMAESLDGLQEQTGVPTIFVECMLENTGNAYRTLGKLLDKEESCNKQADYIENTLSDVREKREGIEEKTKVYYGRGDSGLQTNSIGSIHTEVIEFIGAENVYDDESKAGQSWEEVSMEQINLWNPEVIILGSDGNYDSILKDPVWENIKAVKDGKVYEAPAEPYDWLGSPPNANRIIGIKWLGNLIYPDIYDYDMKEETKEFYKLFYHTDITDEKINELLSKSILK